jgi:hypothetical protein
VRPLRLLVWHVHGSWTTSLVAGRHTYLLPVDAGRGPDGRGRARTWSWPASAVEVDLAALGPGDLDAVLLQRPHEAGLLAAATGLRAGVDVPAVYVEHNTPRGDVPDVRHPVADRTDVPVVHVTATNALLWDTGRAPVHVVEHGVARPGPVWAAELRRAAVAVNDPVRRGRVTGTDLLPDLARAVDLDVFGMRVGLLDGTLPCGPGGSPPVLHEDPPQDRMHAELARRGAYVHPCRWTSLGLSLLEAMAMGMPVAALAATDAWRAVPPGTGLLASSGPELAAAARRLLDDPVLAADLGAAAAAHTAQRYGLGRFLSDLDAVLADALTGPAPALAGPAASPAESPVPVRAPRESA